MRKAVPILELTDYLEILNRRKWSVLACLLVGFMGAGVVFLLLPKVYRSSTLILVESQKVPTDFIKPVTVDTIEERLISIQQQIFSRTLLDRIIKEFNLYKDESLPLEDKIEDMRKHIKVETVDDRLRRNIQAFTIAYEGEKPLTVMRVTNKLASLFIEENLRVREQLVEGTSEFLVQELQSLQETLNLQEKQISDYKHRYMGQLPQQIEANLRTLDRLQMELQNATDSLRMTEEKRDILRDALNDPTGTALPGLSPNRTRLQQLRAQLIQLQSEYKETYPDVIQTKRQIQELEALLAGGAPQVASAGEAGGEQGAPGAEGAQASGEREGADPRNLEAQLRTSEAEIQVRKMRKLETERQIKELERRVDATPAHEQQLSILTRDYDNNRRTYEALLSKKMTAKISESMEKRQKGEQFRIIDPANQPEKPVKPDPLKVFLGGAFAGLVLAGGSIWWLDFRNLPFRRPEEIEAALHLPVLATIPHMSGLWVGEEPPKPLEAVPEEHKWPRLLSAFSWNKKPMAGRRTSAVIQATRNALAAEQFRVLAGRVIQSRAKKGMRILAVTSALPGEGKSTLAMGLAVTLARDYLEDTILIDGDMRNPSVSARLARDDEKGLMNVLAGECALDAALYQHAHPNLKVLTVGTSDLDRLGLPAIRLQMQKLLDDLRHRGAFVILDAPPILPMADMNLYCEIVDGMVLAVRAGQTPQHVVIEALDFLAGGNVEGVVLNDLMSLQGRSYYSGYTSTRYGMLEQPPLLYLPGRSGPPHASGHAPGHGRAGKS